MVERHGNWELGSIKIEVSFNFVIIFERRGSSMWVSSNSND